MDELTHLFYQAAADERLWEPALAGLAGRLRSAAAAHMTYHGLEAVGTRATPLMREVTQAFIDQRVWARDGRIRHFLQAPIHHFVTAEQYFPPEMQAQDEVARLTAAIGLRHQAGTIARVAEGDHLAVFALDRTAEQGPFSPRELARLNHLRGHLTGAAQLAHYLARQRARQAADVLQGIGQAAAVLDRRGTVVACNALFEADFPLWAEHGARQRFRLRDRRAQARLDAAWARLHTGGPVAPIRAWAPQDWPHGEVRRLLLRPLPGAVGDCLLGGHALLVVEPVHTPAPDRLAQRHGLTAKEARLACLLADGTPLREAGQALGLSYSSARTYLDRVYAKTGTHRQAELVRLVLDGGAL